MATNATWLGIDIGGSSAKLAWVDAAGGVVSTTQSAPYDRPTREVLASAVREAVAGGLGTSGAAEVQGVGLAVPGPVGAGGLILRCGNLPALDGVDGGAWLRDVLSDATGGAPSIRVMTDTSAAAAGAWSVDPKPGRVLYLSLGTGVGGAVLDDGQPLTFTRGTPGHLGHLDISGGDPDAPSTQAAGRGAWEAYLGAPALRTAGLPLDDPARCADHPAMDDVLNALARGLRITLALYRMDHIVLLGGVAPIFATHLDALKLRIADGLTTVAPNLWTLSIAATGHHAAAIGAARMALKNTAKS